MAQEILATPRPQVRPRAGRARRLGRRIALGLLVLVGLVVLVAAAAVLWLRAELRASLPQLDGRRAVAGLTAAVSIERDALGVPVVRGKSRLDVARATGFLHAQERFFQMDLMRRQAAGELAELFGPQALPLDKRNRIHRFRARAAQWMARFPAADRELLQAYAAGVNAGLAALGAPPFEYLATRTRPAPWRPEDSVLVAFAMCFELQDESGHRDSALGVLYDTLPPALADFLAPRGGGWEAPLVGESFQAPPVPGPEVVDLRKLPRAAGLERRERPAGGPDEITEAAPAGDPGGLGNMGDLAHLGALPNLSPGEPEPAAGSNNWALSGAHTASGRGLLANDIHLGLGVPNTWYRASLVWPAPDGSGERRVTGVTLPGTPAVVVGSNGRVAWGFTNHYGDWTDLVILEVDPRRPDFYRTPQGWRRFERLRERIRIKGGGEESLEVVSTVWGPLVGRDHRGRPRVLAWTAHREGAIDQHLMRLEEAGDVGEAVDVARASGIPAQNFVVVDAGGRIAWTTIGRVPRRIGYDGRVPVSWAEGTRRWDGWLAPEEVPAVLDPPGGRIWTANARVVEGEMLAKLGDGGYDEGARARQIRDGLARVERGTPADMLAIQLDDRALFLDRWRRLLLGVLSDRAVAGQPQRAELRRMVERGWTGRASVGSAGYRAVRTFRNVLGEQMLEPLTAPCREADPEFRYELIPHTEGARWRLASERPPHLLDPRFASWDEQLLAAVDETARRLAGQGGPELQQRTWGEFNTVRIQHPLSRAIPPLARMLDVPPVALPGDHNMPRVQGPFFGASERLAVSPGLEEEGYFHMPAGQSGHPLSENYRDSNAAWAEGKPAPFLPGKAVHVLTLVPAGSVLD